MSKETHLNRDAYKERFNGFSGSLIVEFASLPQALDFTTLIHGKDGKEASLLFDRDKKGLVVPVGSTVCFLYKDLYYLVHFGIHGDITYGTRIEEKEDENGQKSYYIPQVPNVYKGETHLHFDGDNFDIDVGDLQPGELHVGMISPKPRRN